ncbi:MAG: hypothetical protein EBR82_18735 [Caulobacteraceae bacterium]|nr:hypothetical protein [Caulobacteraceae bacterium]
MAKHKCGKCAGCKKGLKCTMEWKDQKKSWSGSKADEKADKKTMEGMSPKQKAAFKKADEKMDKKNPSKKEDKKMDAALAKKVKKTVPAKKK